MLAALRVPIGWLDQHAAVLSAQILHAATSGLSCCGDVRSITSSSAGIRPGAGTLQSLALVPAGGGLYSGYLWDGAGPALTYNIAAMLSLVAFVLAWAFIRTPGMEVESLPKGQPV
jgi:PPP family 3-phenylpropionic acid transporter